MNDPPAAVLCADAAAGAPPSSAPSIRARQKGTRMLKYDVETTEGTDEVHGDVATIDNGHLVVAARNGTTAMYAPGYWLSIIAETKDA